MALGRAAADVAIDRIGAGPPVAFLLGLAPASDMGAWQRARQRRFLRPLAARFSVAAMTLRAAPPSGATMADLAAIHAAAIRDAFADAPGARARVDVVGVSTGGAIALQLALDHPALVRRLALIATGPRLGPAGARASARCAALIEAGWPVAGLAALADMMPHVVTRVALRFLFRIGVVAVGAGRRWDPLVVARALRAELAFDATSRVGELAAPVLLIAGEKDPCYDVADLRRAASCIAGARLVTYAAGHFGVLRHRRLWPDVCAFLASQ